MAVSSDKYLELCAGIVEAVRTVFEGAIEASKARLEIHDRRAEPSRDLGSQSELPDFEIEMTPDAVGAAPLSILVWPTLELNVSAGRNGMNLELFDESSENLVAIVRGIAEALLNGRLIEIVEVDATGEQFAVTTFISAPDGEVLWKIETFEGGKGEREFVATYSPY